MNSSVDMSSVLAALNRQQRAAVCHLHGPLLVLAGAGTGKTRVITARIANLLAHGIAPESIVAVSFTRKAGNEMKERLCELVGKPGRAMQVSTFHAFGLSILRDQHNHAGLDRKFGVCSKPEQLKVCEAVLRRIESGSDQDARYILPSISKTKNSGIEASSLMQSACPEEQFLGHVLEAYNSELHGRQLVDLDDMVWLPVRILEARADVRRIYQRRYEHLLVDEFQDSNMLQSRLIRCLLNGNRNLCVVGDDDQSIYAFRGARRELILHFPQDYRRTRVMKLTKNYRCSRQIVGVANAVINESQQKRFGKRLVAAKGCSGPVLFVRVQDETATCQFIARDIVLLRGQGRQYEQMAVLARLQADLKTIRNELGKRNVPCGQNGVNVMTLHAAKGLEFPVVYLPGLDEGTLPHWNATKAGNDSIEEERRLFYVGVTRAAERLTLMSTERRRSYACQPSRFIAPLLRQRLVSHVECSSQA